MVAGKLGFDGRVITAHQGLDFAKKMAGKNASLATSEDLVDLVWEDRPALSAEPAYLLDVKYAGKSTAEKLSDLIRILSGSCISVRSPLINHRFEIISLCLFHHQ